MSYKAFGKDDPRCHLFQSRLKGESTGVTERRCRGERLIYSSDVGVSSDNFFSSYDRGRSVSLHGRSFAVKKIALIVAASLAVVGCQNKKSSSGGVYNTDPSVTQVSAPTPVAYQPAPAPYQAQPVIYDSTPAQAYSAPAPQTTGGSYTVKKGDTLYSIAKSRYGNGNQYSKIVSANPGLDPSKLRVGQTITIPQ